MTPGRSGRRPGLLGVLGVAGGLAGALLPGAPAQATTTPDRGVLLDGQARAMSLLGAAVSASRARAFSGTQYVAAFGAGRVTSGVVRVRHVPGLGTQVVAQDNATGAAAAGAFVLPATRTAAASTGDVVSAARAGVLDERDLHLLGRHYLLSVAGPGGCAGRAAQLVEARRPHVAGPGAVAARYWVDRASGLLLRHEVYDAAGRTVRSGAFVDLTVAPGQVPVRPVPAPATTLGEAVAASAAEAELGSRIPARLPGGMALVDVRRRALTVDGRTASVLQASWSDGLWTLAAYAQDGSLHAPPDGFVAERVGQRRVWVHGTAPERFVWSRGGRTWTVLSDAAPDVSRAAVASLVGEEPPAAQGVVSRISRGAARVVSWLNPLG